MKTGPFNLRKFTVAPEAKVQYTMQAGDQTVNLNEYLGRRVSFDFTGRIHCIECSRQTKKSFNQGYCFPCFKRLAACDRCIVSPELCHFHEGTCREPKWGEANCFTPHVVYLANSSGLKVGITRRSQVPTRWIDQGAVQAIPMLEVPDRRASGLLEVAFKKYVADRTNWQRMLKGSPEDVDLEAERERLLELCAEEVAGVGGAKPLADSQPQQFDYPVEVYPAKVKSLNPEKTPILEGVLEGLKGQYVILDTGVFNARRYGGYELSFQVV